MVEHVEGDWKSFHFRMIQPSDYPSVLLHLRNNFYRDEPLCRHIGYEDSMADDFDEYIMGVLTSSNLSFLVLDKATNKIAGVRISSINRKDDHPEIPNIKNKEKTGPILGILLRLSEDAKMFERYLEIDHYVEFVMVSVDKEYRGFGLATEIYDRAFKMLTAMNFPLIKCVFSSPYTQKIARKRGFYELGKINFLDWKDENDQSYFPNATEDECAILMVKELKPLVQNLTD